MRLPGLNGLRAFEAAARYLSMKHAASELFVTPSAVSQLVRGLERDLDVALFERGPRTLSLTREGRALLPGVRNGFRLIAEAAERVRRRSDEGTLTVSAPPFFAETWLVPRLGDFAARHPGVDLRVLTGLDASDLGTGEADVAIRHGFGDHTGMVSDPIVAPPVVPVAAPELVARRGLPRAPADLLHWPRIQDADRGGWALWFAAHGVADHAAARGPSFDAAALTRAAILRGQGVGLLPAPLIAPALAEGALVAVGPAAEIHAYAYYLVMPRPAATRSKVAAFRRWIGEQADRPARVGEVAPTRERATRAARPPRRSRRAVAP